MVFKNVIHLVCASLKSTREKVLGFIVMKTCFTWEILWPIKGYDYNN